MRQWPGVYSCPPRGRNSYPVRQACQACTFYVADFTLDTEGGPACGLGHATYARTETASAGAV